jgi:lysophospholipase L1-like esterase
MGRQVSVHSTTRTILCYGDSNTNGQRSDDVAKGKWPANIRWTGQLQELLGRDYHVIEEGLSGRTTNITYNSDSAYSGKEYIASCLQNHSPISTVVLMLGTNDLKLQFNRDAELVANAIGDLVDDIRRVEKVSPRIIIVSPIHLNTQASDFAVLYRNNYNEESERQSKNLAFRLQKIAVIKSCGFLDASTVAQPGDDGVHLDQLSHAAFARRLAGLIGQKE